MAWIVGYVSQEEADELRARGYDVESAERYNLFGDLPEYLLSGFQEDGIGVAIWVDTDVMKVFDGPDWDGAGESAEARQLIERLAKHFDDCAALDEQVHEAKAQEASAINNAGPEVQLGYLLRHGGLEWLKEYFDEDLKEETK